jgi:hypothetical protein
VPLHEVQNPLLEVVKHADLHCTEEVGIRKVVHITENMSTHLESLVNIARQGFGIRCLGVGVAERSLHVVIPPRVLLVRMHKIPKLVIWTLVPKRDMPLEIV